MNNINLILKLNYLNLHFSISIDNDVINRNKAIDAEVSECY